MSSFQRRTIFLPVDTNFFNSFRDFFSHTDFLPQWKQYFLVNAISLPLETIIGIRRKQFWEKELIFSGGQLIFWLGESIFLHFSGTPASVFFNEILHSDQWERIFWLVETVFFCSELFPSIENRHLNQWKPIFKERLYFN